MVLSDTASMRGGILRTLTLPARRSAGPPVVEMVLSMLTVVCIVQRSCHRVWVYCHARLAFAMAACHVLVQWHASGPRVGLVPLSMAELGL